MTTTAAAIRDRMQAVIEQLVPRAHADVPFVAHVTDVVDDLRAAAADNVPGAFRKFTVRELGDDVAPVISDSQFSLVWVDFEITVAYPQNSRTGDGAAFDRDKVARSDMKQIKESLGMHGAENFTAPHPDACWIREGERTTRERVDGIDFLVIVLRMQFYSAVLA